MRTTTFQIIITEGGAKMKRTIVMAVCMAVALWLMLETNVLVAQDHYTTLTGRVVAVHKGLRKALEVKSDKDQATVIFRVGKKTVYNPNRYPSAGERVKVEYLIEKGVNVGFVVTIIK
jgi:hypothetical protein